MAEDAEGVNRVCVWKWKAEEEKGGRERTDDGIHTYVCIKEHERTEFGG